MGRSCMLIIIIIIMLSALLGTGLCRYYLQPRRCTSSPAMTNALRQCFSTHVSRMCGCCSLGMLRAMSDNVPRACSTRSLT